MARGGRHVRAGGVRLGRRLLRPTGLSARRAGGASLVGGAGLLRRDAALPGGRRRGRQSAGALSKVRLARGDQGRGHRPGAGRAGLGGGARAVGAAAGHAAERRRLGGDGSGRRERHHRAVVRAQAAGCPRHRLQRRQHRRRGVLAALGSGNRLVRLPHGRSDHRRRHGRDHLAARRPGVFAHAAEHRPGAGRRSDGRAGGRHRLGHTSLAGPPAVARPELSHAGGSDGVRPVRPDRASGPSLLAAGGRLWASRPPAS